MVASGKWQAKQKFNNVEMIHHPKSLTLAKHNKSLYPSQDTNFSPRSPSFSGRLLFIDDIFVIMLRYRSAIIMFSTSTLSTDTYAESETVQLNKCWNGKKIHSFRTLHTLTECRHNFRKQLFFPPICYSKFFVFFASLLLIFFFALCTFSNYRVDNRVNRL